MPEFINPGPSRKGWHRLQNVLKCPRYYALSSFSKGQPSTAVPSDPLIKGSLLHMGLAHYYALMRKDQEHWKGRDEGKEYYSPHEAVEMLVADQPPEHQAAWQEWVPLVHRVLDAYVMHWAHDQSMVYYIEKEVQANIFDEERNESYFYTQRVDAVFRHPKTGKWWFVDHKTTFRIMEKTMRKYTLSGQFLGYQMLGQELFGDDWGGVLLNMIGWPQKGKAPEFERKVLPSAPFALSRFKNTLVHAERVIREHKDLDAMEWPGAHHETACWTTYGPCKYFEQCRLGAA